MLGFKSKKGELSKTSKRLENLNIERSIPKKEKKTVNLEDHPWLAARRLREEDIQDLLREESLQKQRSSKEETIIRFFDLLKEMDQERSSKKS